MAFIEVNHVSKDFKVYPRQKGFMNTVKSLIYRPYEIKKAVDDIHFHINKGELVGYIGANGAGKSTTIKMLSGILVPTSGTIEVDGRIPYLNRQENAMHIGVVFGQRSQLYWDLPMEETFDLYQKMYKVELNEFRRNVEFFVELLDMKEFIRRPVRQLSLGQKMRANLAVAMLHNPDIVYLDEPTIGLDVMAKSRIREFIREVNKEKKTTVILTTHDMDDIEQICDRIIMIDGGKIIHDGTLSDFKHSFNENFMISIDFSHKDVVIEDERLKIIKDEGTTKHFIIDKSQISVGEAITLLTRHYDVNDLSIKEPDIEETVKRIYENKWASSN